ncbi:MAG: hypothetical protein RJQ21_04220 [Rhodospirillales bacterium]
MQPTKAEIYGESPEEEVSPDVSVSDIRYPIERLIDGVAVPVIDPTENLRAAARASSDPLYYAVDMHYTPRGYEVVGNTVGEFLKSARSLTCS